MPSLAWLGGDRIGMHIDESEQLYPEQSTTVKLEIDLAADKVVAAEKEGRKIAIEIKSFLNNSAITDFHAALGQFLNYRLGLQMTELDRILYLAVPEDTFESFFQERFVQEAIKLHQLRLLIYDSDKEAIVSWKE
ncbi:MAG: hypothetical protein RLZZ511_4300 [Cyanobacteriota bacterium]|jgi:hypothetical protein